MDCSGLLSPPIHQFSSLGSIKKSFIMAGIITRLLTQNPLINAIAGNIIWNTAALDYTFVDPIHETRIFSEIPNTYEGVFHSFDANPELPFKDSILAAFAAFERVTNLTFNPVDDFDNATLKIAGLDDYHTSIGSTAGTADLPGNNPNHGSFSDFESYLLLNTSISTALLPAEMGGANSFLSTTLHELGHVVGLDHPHDQHQGTIPITGVGLTDPHDIALDNRRYTVLSYEDGGLDVLYGRGYGHSAGPGALDIAALQAMYGVNPNTNQTDTVYTLTDPQTAEIDVDGNDGSVQIGRAFFSIWDAGGVDTLTYKGEHNVVLNLNEATLNQVDDVETQAWINQTQLAKHYPLLPAEFQDDIEDPNYHAGGFFSRIFRNSSASGYDLGGFSIAQGATIEKAIASNGNDFLIGNRANNSLESQEGEDFLHGSLGDDTLNGGAGNDELYGGQGNDVLIGGEGADLLALGWGQDIAQGTLDDLKGDRIQDFEVGDKILAIGSRFSDVSVNFDGVNSILSFGPAGNSVNLTLAGNFENQTFVTATDPNAPDENTIVEIEEFQVAPMLNVIVGSEADDQLIGSRNKDSLVGEDGNDILHGEAGADQLYGGAGQDRLIGGHGSDVIVGGQGNDRLIGGKGFDSLTGGEGQDKFVFQHPHQMADTILDFDPHQDLLLLKGSEFGFESTQAPLLKLQFTVGAQASQHSNRLIYNDANGKLLFDADGCGSGKPILLAQLAPMLSLSHTTFRIMKH